VWRRKKRRNLRPEAVSNDRGGRRARRTSLPAAARRALVSEDALARGSADDVLSLPYDATVVVAASATADRCDRIRT